MPSALRCRMLCKPGRLYCGEHAVHAPDNQDRIPCPNDGKHTVLKKELQQHLKKCNSRLSEAPWIVEDLNAVKGETKSDAKTDRRPTQEEMSAVVDRVEKCYATFAARIEKNSQLNTELVELELTQCQNRSDEAKKHLIQISAIIGHMQDCEILPNNDTACVFELGAGKAQLAYWMAKTAPLTKFLLVDRSGARNKWDNKALQENSALKIDRLRCSIEHLDLSKVPLLKDTTRLSAVCKHFCGSATDAGIRCLLNGVSRGLSLTGFVLVPCCHHKSRIDEYTGREFLAAHNLDGDTEFSVLRHFASWATCGIVAARAESVTGETDTKRIRLNAEGSDTGPWSAEWKEELGIKTKAILEWGRVENLRSAGFECSLVQYVDRNVSPENLLIIGKKIKKEF